ncbi:putative acyltransferase domain protein [Clostridium sp. CAG:729]|nr:putative acyltransferase domain protein [Clostridium sp. CAG:729]
MEKKRFYNIDFLRFIASIIIVLFHIFICEIRHIKELGDFTAQYMPYVINGRYWVDFFFITAGFFLFYSKKNNDFINFVKIKLIRLLPVIWFAVIVYMILSWFDLLNYKKYINVYTMLLINNIGLTTKNSMGNIHPVWFVSSLFWASLFYYYLKSLLSKKWFNFITIHLVLIFYVYIVNATVSPAKIFENFICIGYIRALAGLGLGYFLYLAYQKFQNFKFGILQRLFITFMEIYLLVFAVRNTVFHNISFKNISIFILTFAGMILLFTIKKGYLSTILNNKFLGYLGKYSYSIFVMHIIILDLIKKNLWVKNIDLFLTYPFLNIAIIILMCILAGILTYHLVEEPALKYLTNKFCKKPKTLVRVREYTPPPN